MTLYRQSGGTYYPTTEANLRILKELPVDNYLIKIDKFENLFFEPVSPFILPTKIYGDALQNAGRILNTYKDRELSTGVLLTGEKGSGKTLLAKAISEKGGKLGYITIIINTPYCGDAFNELIQNVRQPCIVLFDEFEKVYDKDDQQKILTLLDGVFPTKKLFVFTCNDKHNTSSYLLNRPGRIFYYFDYGALEPAFITEYCKDVLKDELKHHTPLICQIAGMFYAFNFDMLKAIVEEMNRYMESPQEVMKFINASPANDVGKMSFSVELTIGGIPIPKKDIDESEVELHPLTIKDRYWVYYTVRKSDGEEDGGRYEGFTSNDIKDINHSIGRFTFVNSAGNILVLTKKVPESPYGSYFKHLI